MSLRVLLADESSSIKKAFELALQDYQVKVQTVHQGVDVNEIHQSFQPDICFMDIMLPKLNGYDACKALKENSDTPVVLMWSGFMELDSEKFKASGAEGSIEKPFETKTLRELVQKLVSSLNQNEISSHLIFDEDDDDEMTDPNIAPNLPNEYSSDSSNEASDLPPLDSISLDDDEDDEKTDPNYSVPSPLNSSINASKSDRDDHTELPEIDTSFLDDLDSDMDPGSDMNADSSDDWSDEDMNLAPEGLDDVDSFSVASLDDDDDLPFENMGGPEGLDLPPIPAPDFGLKTSEKKTEKQLPPLENNDETEVETPEPLKVEEDLIVSNNAEIPQLSKEELKRLILAQSKDIIESVVWDVVPELAKEMIQKEINRLTGEVQIESDLR
jgi:CheY-like chemotaxis protein